MAKKTSNWSKMVEAMFESNQAVIDAVRRGNERGLRFSQRLVSEAERSQQELTRLRDSITGSSKNQRNFYQESVDVARRSADHSAELAEEFVSAAGDAGEELRGTVTAIIEANRNAAQALIAAIDDTAAAIGLSARRRPAKRPSNRKRKSTTTRAAIERTVEQAAATHNNGDR